MNLIKDEAFGELRFEHLWVGDYRLQLFGREYPVRLLVEGDEGVPVEPAQREAYLRFEKRKDQLLKQAEDALFAHYQEVAPEYRAQFGRRADELAPELRDKQELARLVEPKEIFFQESYKPDRRVVGLLLECSWEPELGVAVKFVNEAVDEVGPQDIVI
jgi:hypothetical protein